MNTLSIVIPVFNENKTIDILIESVFRQTLVGWKKEIIIIDDGSTDGTDKRLKRWEKKCKVILQSKNHGKGSALREGFKHVHGEIILIQDADLEYSPTDYEALLKPFDNPRVDVVYGSRFLGAHLSTMFLYALGNHLVTFITNILYNTNITDMETGYKVFRKKILDSLTLEANSFDIEPEITAKILLSGHQIYEVPISYYGRKFNEGKKLTWRDGIFAVLTLIKYRF